MYACLNTSKEIVKLLIQSNADINALDNGGKSAIFYLIYSDTDISSLKKYIAEILLKNGADIKIVDAYADFPIKREVYDPINNLTIVIDTLLELAAFRDDVKAVEILLRHGANHIFFDQHIENVNKFLELYASDEVKELIDKYRYKYGCYRY